jgi:medium-chain acyl-[acyl-carrier-protein] hydrolase
VTSTAAFPPLVRLGARPDARRRLFCVPYAGGGVAPFRAWLRTLPDDIEVVAAQLPGRDARLREAPLPSIAAMVEMLLPAVMDATDLPYAIFGHSMGALVAYELTCALEASGVRAPSHLFVSSRRAPDALDTRPPLHNLPEAEFIEQLQHRYGAIPPAVLEERELLELMLPVVRSDIRAVETYRAVPGTTSPIQCPVHVYGGATDKHPSPSELPAWDRVTASPVRVRVFPGDHFYLQEQREALTADIALHWQMAGRTPGRT